MLGQVDRHAVRACELDLDVASLRHLFCSRVRTVHGTRLLDLRPCLFHVLDLETEVVDAGVPERALCLGGLVVFELEDREVYVAVAQVVALGGWGVDLTHLLQAEALNIELASSPPESRVAIAMCRIRAIVFLLLLSLFLAEKPNFETYLNSAFLLK